ncbi:MAG: DUF2313 domain-containing protein [Firmicutes bacterium]|nr:DUF2313 domain-containing protein [Bacillota bacterium]
MIVQSTLLKLLHKIYRKDKLTLELTKAISVQLYKVKQNIQEIAKQQYLDSASWGLDIFEKELNIKGKSKPVEQRQAVIQAKWRGAGKLTLLLIQRTLQCYITGNVIVAFQKRLMITIQGEILQAVNLYDVVHTIEEVKPAHIGWDFKYILPDVQNTVAVGSFVQSAIYIHVLPYTLSEWKTEANIAVGSRVHVGIYLEVRE